jgi:hypothetical protein
MFAFTIDDLLLIFQRFNLAVWPLQIVAYVLGLVAVFFAIKQTGYSMKIVLAILAFHWLWAGIVFCLIYWAPSYPSAYVLGVLCIVQGILFLVSLFRSNLSDCPGTRAYFIVGIVFVIYALAGYPIVGYLVGHVYPKSAPFGLVPCPTAVFTFGLFLLVQKKFPGYYLAVPVIVAIAGLVAIYKGVYEDIGLFISGIIGTYLLVKRYKTFGQTA